MSGPEFDTVGLGQTESLLAALRPAAAGIDRDRLMFRAGEAAAQASARRSVRIWQGVSGLGASLASLALLAALAPFRWSASPDGAGSPPAPVPVADSAPAAKVKAPVDRIEAPPVRPERASAPVVASAALPDFSYARLQRRVIEEGVGALPAAKSGYKSEPIPSLFGDRAGGPRLRHLPG